MYFVGIVRYVRNDDFRINHNLEDTHRTYSQLVYKTFFFFTIFYRLSALIINLNNKQQSYKL